jgi:hypothetical protein
MKCIMTRRLLLSAVAAVIALGADGPRLEGYTAGAYKWDSDSVSYFVNPRNKWVPESAAVAAFQMAADGWSQQSQANVQLVYAGYTSGSSLTMNRKNEVFFRDSSNGSYIAETYYWWDGAGRLIDADVVLYEGKYKFFAFSGCSNGIYIESVGIHEFGHMLGLLHSSVSGATMAPKMPGSCDRTQLELDPDDIAGIEAMYPPAAKVSAPAAPSKLTAAESSASPTSSLVLSWQDNASDETGYGVERSLDGTTFSAIAQLGASATSYTDGGLASGTLYHYRVAAFNAGGISYSNIASGQTRAATNTAPSVAIANPSDGASYPDNVAITFSGVASDTQDGDITATLAWTSSLAGAIGTGGSFSKTLSAGTHVITAQATDGGGLTGTGTVTMTITSGVSGPVLTAAGYKVKGEQKVDLTWSGLHATSVDVYRNGSQVGVVSNSGAWTDHINRKGGGAYTYTVCAAGTATCSNQVTVSF